MRSRLPSRTATRAVASTTRFGFGGKRPKTHPSNRNSDAARTYSTRVIDAAASRLVLAPRGRGARGRPQARDVLRRGQDVVAPDVEDLAGQSGPEQPDGRTGNVLGL